MARLKGMLAGISPIEIDPPLTPTVQGSWPRAASLLALVGTCASGAGTERRLLPLPMRLLRLRMDLNSLILLFPGLRTTGLPRSDGGSLTPDERSDCQSNALLLLER